jgi:hypothetical protein
MIERRAFLQGGAALLGGLVAGPRASAGGPGDGATLLHHAPRATRVIWLHMAGSPSQLDLWDHKPQLARLDGKPVPESFIENERFAFIKGTPKLLASPHGFARHGESGQWVSELLPHTAGIVDKLCVVRSMRTNQFNHAPAQVLANTGHSLIGRPSMGAWLSARSTPTCRHSA